MKRICILLVLALPALVMAQTVSDEIVYGHKDGMALTMVMVTPQKAAKGKAIISLVSGNWISNYGMLKGYTRSSMIYAEKGYTVFMVMHGSQPRYSIQDETADVRRAVRYVRHHAKRFGIDSLNIGITGSSSGGHLSLITALTPDSIDIPKPDEVDKVSGRVQAVAVFYPPTDFLNWGGSNFELQQANLKQFGVAGAFDFKVLSDSTGLYEHITDPAEVKKIAAALSPVNQVTVDDPPVIVTHGDNDKVVPLQQSEILVKALKAAKVPVQFILKPGGGHGWGNSEEQKELFIDWFDKYL